MKVMKMQTLHSERGNALIYILIATALFATLIYNVSESGRGGTTALTQERAKLLATELIEYSNIVAQGVSQMRLRGTTLAQLRFAHPDLSTANYGSPDTDPGNEVFNIQGGGIVYKQPPGEVRISGDPLNDHYIFASDNEVVDVGTTCGAAGCADLIMALPGIPETVCSQINTLLGVPNPSDAPPQESDVDVTNFFQGTMGYSDTIGNDSGSTVVAGKTAACVYELDGNEVFTYYRVLWSQ